MRLRTVIASTALAGLLGILVGCGSSSEPRAGTPSAATPPPIPQVGLCRNLTFDDVAHTSNNDDAVPCSRAHTAVTVAVGRLKSTNVNSSAVQHQLTVACPRAVRKHVGGTTERFNLSLLVPIWFIPEPSEIAAGADWYRCDVVAVSSTKKLSPLRGKMRGALAKERSLDHWGSCGNTAPSGTKFRRYLCSEAHQWRAVSTIAIPKKSAYLAKATSTAASKACRSIASDQSKGALKYSWSFQWPNKQQWKAGQRYGLCWLPTKN